MECEWSQGDHPGLIQTTLHRTQAPGQVLGDGGGSLGAEARQSWASLPGCEISDVPGDLSGFQSPRL